MRPSSGGLRRLRQVPPEEQWNGYLKNIGAYSGRRAVCDSRGTVIADFQAEVVANLFRSGDNACDEFLLWKATVQTADGSESSEEEWSRDELAEMGAVAADGSFSLGPTVFCGEEFVIEQCVHEGPSRIRTILAFDWEGRLCGLTACREKRAARRNEQSSDHESQAHSSDDKSQQTEIEPAAWRSPNILLDYLLGTWTGRGIIVDRATRSARLVRSEHRWKQTDGLKVRQISGLQVQGSSLCKYQCAESDLFFDILYGFSRRNRIFTIIFFSRFCLYRAKRVHSVMRKEDYL